MRIVKNGFVCFKNIRLCQQKMSRTNFFAALESDDEDSRDGADTRKKEMATSVRIHVRGGQTAADCDSWGDVMTGMRYEPNMLSKKTVANTTQLHKDLCDEPWKYGDEIVDRWNDIVGNSEMEEYWRHRDERTFKPVPDFTPIAKECAKLCMKRWVERDIRRHVARIKSSLDPLSNMLSALKL